MSHKDTEIQSGVKKEMPDDGGLGSSVAYDYQYNKFQEFRRQFPGVWAILFEIC